MNESDKRTADDLVQMINEFKRKQDMYSELPKDKLIDRLIWAELELQDETFVHVCKEDMVELWYFVGDETGTKYLSDKKPEIYFIAKYEDFGDDGDTMYAPQQVMMTDGEINIRVPKKMESMFPCIKYGDDPIKVKVANLTL